MPFFSRLTGLGFFPGLAPHSAAQPEYFLTPTSGVAPNGLTYFNWDQGALQLDRAGLSWSAAPGTPITVSYGFRASGGPPAGNGVSVFQQFNATQITVAEEMLRLWSEVANITFTRVGSGTSGPGAYTNNATILFGNFVNGPAQFSAFAYLPDPAAVGPGFDEGDVWVNISRDYDADPLTFTRGAHILAHEIGHAIGLLHPSEYDGGAQSGVTYAGDADFWQDTSQFTNMSYFWETETGANYAGLYASAPQLFDIAAAQYLYGANMSTRTGDSVYGFNSNSGHNVFSIFSSTQPAIFCIWDAGGNDTLDLSGYTLPEQIDLREMAFSSAGSYNGIALVGNISIARGAVIENAIGGSAADIIVGNAANNQLTGGGGADTIDGGAGIDTAVFTVSSTSASWTRTFAGGWTVNAGGNGVDSLIHVERLHFSNRDVVLDNAQQSFYGNGASDVLWRNANDGQVAIWELNGAAVTGASVVGSGAAPWTIINTGDFSGDGRDDILWRNTSDGQILAWRDGSWQSASFYGSVATSWVIAGVGDFNFDGRDDFLWRNTSDGLVGIWLLNGATSLSQGVIGAAPLDWSIVAVADFDGDGRDDILWRQDTGLLARWTTNGTAQTGASIIGNVPTEWTVAGTGDFDGDGRADILWRNNVDGAVAIWLMDGATKLADGIPGGAPLDWHVVDVGDYNADGRDDLLWRNDDGTLAIWTMNGFTANAQIVAGVPTEWGVI